MKATNVFLGIAFVAVSAACSAGGGGSSSGTGSGTASGPRTALLSIVIPAAGAGTLSRVRHPAYISPATQTLAIAAIYGTASPGPAEDVDVSAGSHACVAGAGGTRTCNVSVAVQTGATAFDVRAEDGGGKLLAHALVTLPDVSSPVVDISITLGGDPASVILAIVGGEFQAGVSGNRTLDVTAEDADDNVIGLPGAFDIPISLTASDASVSVSPAQIIDPGDTAVLFYDGNPTAQTVITASVSGAISTTAVVRVVGTGPPPTPGPTPTGSPNPTVTAIVIIQ